MPRMLDSNVLLDIVTADTGWLAWSTEQFRQAAAEGMVILNPIIPKVTLITPDSAR